MEACPVTKPRAVWVLWFRNSEGWFPFFEMRMLDGSSTKNMIVKIMTKYLKVGNQSVFDEITYRILPEGKEPRK